MTAKGDICENPVLFIRSAASFRFNRYILPGLVSFGINLKMIEVFQAN